MTIRCAQPRDSRDRIDARGRLPVLSILLLLALAAGCAATRRVAMAPRVPTGAKSPSESSANYALVIDAGSSASRLQIFEWRSGGTGGLPEIEAAPASRAVNERAWEFVVDGGLSNYAAEPARAGESLEPLLDFALQKLTEAGVDPTSASLHLKATAGLRLLPERTQSAIMDDVRESLAGSPFDFGTAEIISGAQEGLFGWISVNYLLGHLGRGPFQTVGALDLGGASTQITFMPIDFPRGGGAKFALGGTSYNLYSHSYLGFGQDEGLVAVAAPSCYPRGYPIPEGTAGIAARTLGTGDYAACRQAIRTFLTRPCEAPPCSLMGVYQPPLYGDFLAFSGYGYVSAFFDLDQNLSLRELERLGTEYCATEWEQILRDRPDADGRKYLPGYCFKAAYVVTLLTEGLGFALDNDRIATPRAVQGSEVSWILGSLIYELSGSAD